MAKNNQDKPNGPYMDLMSDFGFKRLFASEPNKPLLIDFLNQLFKGQKVVTDLEKWLFMLKNMSRLKKIPVYLRKPIFQRVFQIAEIGALTKEERMLYDASLKAKRDWDNTVAWAAQHAAEQAAEQKSYEVVRNLIADFDFTDEQAAKASQTSIAFVQKVRKELGRKKK